MKNWQASEATMDFLKTRFADWQVDNMQGCDDAIRNLIVRLNSNPDVVPVFSCEGHVDTDTYKAYVMLAANERGIDWLRRVYTWMVDNTLDIAMRTNITISFAYRVKPAAYGEQLYMSADSESYPAVLIHCDIYEEFMQDAFLNLFTQAIDTISR